MEVNCSSTGTIRRQSTFGFASGRKPRQANTDVSIGGHVKLCTCGNNMSSKSSIRGMTTKRPIDDFELLASKRGMDLGSKWSWLIDSVNIIRHWIVHSTPFTAISFCNG